MMTFLCIFDGPQIAKTCENVANSSKILLRPGRLFESILDHFGNQKSPKMEPKTLRKMNININAQIIQKWWPNGRQNGINGCQNGAKRDSKREPGRAQRGAKTVTLSQKPPETQTGSEMEPKWSQNEAKMEPRDPKWCQNEAEMLDLLLSVGWFSAAFGIDLLYGFGIAF